LSCFIYIENPKYPCRPWIRVTTPYAGKGKGMHILPEIGEEVMVGFENGNAEKPIVMGTMFHGQGKSGHGGAGNFMKGLQTASGNKLQMNDKDGSVFMSDKGGADMKFDGAGNATTNANVNHDVNAGSQHKTKVGKEGESTLTMNAAGVIDLSGKSKVTIKVSETSFIEITGTSITVKSDNVIVSGKDTIDISSKNNHIGGGPTKIDGGDVFIN